MESRRVRTARRLNHCLGCVRKECYSGWRCRGPISELDDLHDDEIDKIDGAGLVQLLLIVVTIDRVGQISEREPNFRKMNPVSLKIPIRHGE